MRNRLAKADAPVGAHSASLSSLERSADAAATDWQIILHLRNLFESDPSLISTLMDGVGRDAPAGFVETLLVAAREALAERSESIDLHLHVAMATAQAGRPREAESLLHRVLEFNPGHAGATALLAGISARESGHGDAAKPNPIESLHANSPAATLWLGGDRRGNELPS